MSGYAAGKFANAVVGLTGAVLAITCGLVAAASLFSQQFGPITNAIVAAIVVYLAAFMLSGRKLIGVYRLGTVSGAFIGGYLGGLVYPHMGGGFLGGLVGGIATGVLCSILMIVGWVVVDKVSKAFGSK